MFFKPFDENTFMVYDLTRSTVKKPYSLDYGFSDVVCDKTYYTSHDPEEDFTCMLEAEDRKLRTPMFDLTRNDISEIIEFSLSNLADDVSYKIGYRTGFKDVMTYMSRETFAHEKPHNVSFLAGYELGIYLGIYYKQNNLGTVPPELSSFQLRPSRSKMLREYSKRQNRE